MEQVIAVEVWMALIGASCITGWLIGDWNGSERMRKLIGTVDTGGLYEYEPLSLPSKPGAERAAAISGARAGHNAKQPKRGFFDQMQGCRFNQDDRRAALHFGMRNFERRDFEHRAGDLRLVPAAYSPAIDAPKTPDARIGRSNTERKNAGDRDQKQFDVLAAIPTSRPLSELPVLSELHAKAEAIRRTEGVWDHFEVGMDLDCVDSTSAKVLDHYQSSIDSLQRINSAP